MCTHGKRFTSVTPPLICSAWGLIWDKCLVSKYDSRTPARWEIVQTWLWEFWFKNDPVCEEEMARKRWGVRVGRRGCNVCAALKWQQVNGERERVFLKLTARICWRREQRKGRRNSVQIGYFKLFPFIQIGCSYMYYINSLLPNEGL